MAVSKPNEFISLQMTWITKTNSPDCFQWNEIIWITNINKLSSTLKLLRVLISLWLIFIHFFPITATLNSSRRWEPTLHPPCAALVRRHGEGAILHRGTRDAIRPGATRETRQAPCQSVSETSRDQCTRGTGYYHGKLKVESGSFVQTTDQMF